MQVKTPPGLAIYQQHPGRPLISIELASPQMNWHKVAAQKTAYVTVWECVSTHIMSNLHTCECTTDVERYIWNNICCHPDDVFSSLFQQSNVKILSGGLTTVWLWRKKRCTACSPDCPRPPWKKHVVHYKEQDTATEAETPDCWGTEVTFEARMGQNSILKI